MSPALSARLQAAETVLESLQDGDRVVDARQIMAMIGPIVDAYRRRVEDLPATIKRAPDVARKVMSDGGGPIMMETRIGNWVTKMGLELQPLLAAGGLPVDVVAGAGFGNHVPPYPARFGTHP